jgi:hypothetical protein
VETSVLCDLLTQSQGQKRRFRVDNYKGMNPLSQKQKGQKKREAGFPLPSFLSDRQGEYYPALNFKAKERSAGPRC